MYGVFSIFIQQFHKGALIKNSKLSQLYVFCYSCANETEIEGVK